MRGNIVVGQSGGPTAVINSSVAGVYAAAKKLGVKKIYGMVHGIEGFLQDNLVDLGEYLDDETGIELLKRTPSAFLGSCRFKMPKIEGHEDVYEKVFEIMEKHDIECLFYAGGNDSMDTVKMLSDYAAAHNKPQRFMGVPKTIDNDLPVTDHCPGYGSAAKYIATSMKEIIRDNESFGVEKPTVCIVEIMGRHAGWLTAAAALSRGDDCTGPDAIYLPEVTFDMDKFMEKVKYLAATKSSVVIAVSEGVALADGRFVCELGNASDFVDAFGHKQLHTGALTPYDIIHSLLTENSLSPQERMAIDTTWRAQEDFTGSENALVVIDGSASMYVGTSPLPAAVALSLGIYYAERNTGVFHNHFITFSQHPRLVEINGRDICEKVRYCRRFNEVANTNLQRVFDLILETARENHIPQKDMPAKLYIISDMEFDCCVSDGALTNYEYARRRFAV